MWRPPPPGGRRMAALASSMGVNDGWLHDGPVDHQRTSALLDNGAGPSLHPETHSDPNLFAAKDPGQPSIARCPLAAGVEERPADATDKSHRCSWGFPDQRAWTADSAVKRAITLTSLRAKTASSRRRYRCDRYRVWEHHHTYYDRYFCRGSDRRVAKIADTNNVAAMANCRPRHTFRDRHLSPRDCSWTNSVFPLSCPGVPTVFGSEDVLDPLRTNGCT